MAPLATAFIRVEADDRGFLQAVDRNGKQASTSLQRDMTEAGSKSGKGFGDKFSSASLVPIKSLGAAAGGVLAGIGLTQFLGDAIGAASDLNETVSKTKNVFGDSAAGIIDWSKDSATSFGLSQQAALAATSQFGDMFHQLGFTQQQSAQTSEQLVKMAADLGSFHNVDPSDVLDRIGASLRGEYDSLQQLIPNINAARVQQEALNETHKTSVDALTAAEKATATLTIIQRDGANAANDFAETSGGLANQQRILSAEFKNMEAQLGAALLPVITDFVHVLNVGVIPAVEGTGHAVGAVVGFFQDNEEAAAALGAVLAVALVPSMARLTVGAVQFVRVNVAQALFLASQGAKEMAASATAAQFAMGPIGVIAAASAVVVVRSWKAQQEAINEGKKAADDYVGSLIKSNVSVDTMTASLTSLQARFASSAAATVDLSKHGDILGDSFMKQYAEANALGQALEDQRAATARIATNQAALAHQYHLTTAQVETLAAVNNIDLTGSLDGASAAFKKAYTATAATHHPLSAAQADFKKVSDNALSASDQVNALREAFDLLVGNSLSADEATITFHNDLAELNAKLKESHHSLSLTTQSGRDAREQFDRTAQSALDMATAQKQNSASNKTVKATLDAAITSLEKAGGDNAYVKTQVDKLKEAERQLLPHVKAVNAELNRVPDNPYSGVHLPGTSGLASSKFSASGGLVTGPGTKTSDSVPMRLSAGEFVVQASAVDKFGVDFFDAINAGKFHLPSLPAAGSLAPAAVAGGPSSGSDALLAEQNALLREQNALLAQQPAATGAHVAASLNGLARSAAHNGRGTVPVS